MSSEISKNLFNPLKSVESEVAWADHVILDYFYGHLPPAPRRTPMRELVSTV